jgi:hypothetical protein
MTALQRRHLVLAFLVTITVLHADAQVTWQGIEARAGMRSSSRSAGRLFEDSVSTAADGAISVPARNFQDMDHYVTTSSAGEPIPNTSYNQAHSSPCCSWAQNQSM